MIRTYQIALAAGVTRLSAGFAGDESKSIPFRQLILQASGADAVIGGDATVTAPTGFKIAITATVPLSLGPFSTGPIKLSDLYGIGAGSTLSVLGIPY